MIRKCLICGKEVAIMSLKHYMYKKAGGYACSVTCNTALQSKTHEQIHAKNVENKKVE